MHCSRADGLGRRLLLPPAAASRGLVSRSGLLGFPLAVALAVSVCAQDTGTLQTELYGKGVAINVVVHSSSGEPVSSATMVKLLRDGFPAGQAATTQGRAELVVNGVGNFTVVVEAAGYPTAQKEVTIDATGRAQVDVYLRSPSSSASSPALSGRPVLAPKAKKAVDQGLEALAANNLGKAQKHAIEAMRLAPGHPDVLYLQGVVYLKERDWTKAQEVLEKATQVDSSNASAFAALGMALCDQGKYDSAAPPLEKAVKLTPNPSWDTRWALAKTYYQQAHYDQALQMSEMALSSSNGKAPEIGLLVAQSLTAVGRYEEAAQTLREFLRDHGDRREAATARR